MLCLSRDSKTIHIVPTISSMLFTPHSFYASLLLRVSHRRIFKYYSSSSGCRHNRLTSAGFWSQAFREQKHPCLGARVGFGRKVQSLLADVFLDQVLDVLLMVLWSSAATPLCRKMLGISFWKPTHATSWSPYMSTSVSQTLRSLTSFLDTHLLPWLARRVSVETTPQLTRFRDGKVCNNLATDELTITEYSLTTSA